MRTYYQVMNDLTAEDLRSMDIFELTDEQLRERLRPAYEAMKEETFEKGLYITYSDPAVCPTTSHMVHEYRDRKELIWMDDDFIEHFVKTL